MDQSEAGKKGYAKTKHQLKAYRQRKSKDVRTEYENNPKYCPNCDEKIPFEKRNNKFCNQSCSASYNNRGVVRVETSYTDICAYCEGVKETRQNKYCNSCIEANVYSTKKTALEEAMSDRVRKRLLIESRGYQCESCGLAEWLGDPIALELDHIDGDPDNNDEQNLRVICPNCHAKTETYKGANSGNSSRHKMRRRRYKEGKTF
ncbi:MAG: HNH endonuclease signature motif containing protein [Phototrophicaceae bacterium]